jgi:septal ring factor EnvC (AmiA/AmiB activator)
VDAERSAGSGGAGILAMSSLNNVIDCLRGYSNQVANSPSDCGEANRYIEDISSRLQSISRPAFAPNPSLGATSSIIQNTCSAAALQTQQQQAQAEEEARTQQQQAQAQTEEEVRTQQQQAQAQTEEEVRTQQQQAQAQTEEEVRTQQQQAQAQTEEERAVNSATANNPRALW